MVVVKRIIGTDVLLVAVGTALVLSACSTETSGTKTDQSANAAADSSPPAASALEPGAAAEPDDGRANTPDAEAKQPPPDPDYCASKDLSLALGEAEGAAGTVYRPLKFTNVSDFPCVLHGFPGVSYVAGEDGHQVGKPATHTGQKGQALTLRPGEVAHADVGFTQVANFDPAVCQPTEVRGLRIYPPKETASLFVEIPGTGCASDELPGNQLTVASIEPGAGGH